MFGNNKLGLKVSALLLLIAFAIPFTLNSLHYVLFQHHDHPISIIDDNSASFSHNSETHTNCLWDFATSISNIDNIPFFIVENIFIRNQRIINFYILENKLFYFSLRAPPFNS